MKKMKWFGIALALCMTVTACGSQNGAVFVQSVASLTAMGGIAPGDRFAGIVVSENVAEIQKDAEKSIKKLSVREGDDVKEGQELFSYDTDELLLTLDKQILQQDQLMASIENYKLQISELEKDRDRSYGRNKLQYTIQIQSTQVELKEAQLNLKAKASEVAKTQNILDNATVVSPVDGRVQSINESGTDNNGKKTPYITIQQSGAYRVKGMLNELQKGGLMEGDRIRISSRTDASVFWIGTVALVDYENPSQGNQNNMYGMESDEMTTSSRYPFYVDLDSSDGMILGQHVYLSLDSGEEEVSGLQISSAFVCFDENDNAFVWAENGRHKLEKRSVTLGAFNGLRDTYEILDGITEEDYLAFPDEELCHPGAPATRVQPQTEGGV